MPVFNAMQKQYDAAIGYFKKAVDVFPIFVEAQYNLAVAYKSIFDIANMIRAFKKVLDLTRPGTDVYTNARDMIQGMEKTMGENNGVGLDAFISAQIALCYAKMGNKQAALAAFDKAIAIDPDYEPAILNKAATEELSEGQCLSPDLKITRYYGTKMTSG